MTLASYPAGYHEPADLDDEDTAERFCRRCEQVVEHFVARVTGKTVCLVCLAHQPGCNPALEDSQ